MKIIRETSFEVLGMMQAKKQKTWFDEERKMASLKKNDAYKTMLNRKTRASTELYRELENLRNASTDIKREKTPKY